MTLRMPAEWERQEAVWLAWPHNKEDWPDRFGPIPWVYAEIIRYLTQVGQVRLVVKNARQQEEATGILERHGVNLDKVDFIPAATDRVWLRDSGPIFVEESQGRLRGQKAESAMSARSAVSSRGQKAERETSKVLLDFRFNAWAKYDNWKRDDKIPAVAERFLTTCHSRAGGNPGQDPRLRGGDNHTVKRIQPTHKGKRVVLEGGGVDVNGQGTLLATEECLLSKIQCRNPGFTRDDYEQVFAKYLGISNVIWLGDGIVGDDTHGHVDDLARFVNPTTVVAVAEKNKNDDNYALLQNNTKRLKRARDQDGKPLTVAELPMPRPIIFEGQRLPASYANFLIANSLVLAPVFNDTNDRVALNVLAELFPRHDVIPIYCGDFIWGLGTIHCASQQEIA